MSYSSVVLAKSPIRYYRLGDSGATAHDSGSQAQDGTLNGGITTGQTGLIAGDANTSMLFDGSTGYISLPTTGLPTGAAAWSMEAWVKMPSVPTTGLRTIMSFGTRSGTQFALLAYGGADNGWEVWDWASRYIFVAGAATANTVYHVVLTYNGTTLTLYLNGSSIGTSAATLNIVLTEATIGWDHAGTDFFSGDSQEAAWYSGALSAAQVLANYTAGTGIALSSTLAGAGTLEGTLSLKTALTTTLAGAGTLTGTLSLATALTATFAGVGTLFGNLAGAGRASHAHITLQAPRGTITLIGD
jgi:Concanavalin A-like lectin/glucanases superfamily